MIKIIPIIDQTKDGDVRGSVSGKQQHNAIRSAIKKIPHDELEIDYNHFMTNGFIRRDETIVYFSTCDFRNTLGTINAYARYAKSFKDYSGGFNNVTRLVVLDTLVENLLSKKEN